MKRRFEPGFRQRTKREEKALMTNGISDLHNQQKENCGVDIGGIRINGVHSIAGNDQFVSNAMVSKAMNDLLPICDDVIDKEMNIKMESNHSEDEEEEPDSNLIITPLKDIKNFSHILAEMGGVEGILQLPPTMDQAEENKENFATSSTSSSIERHNETRFVCVALVCHVLS